MLLYRRLHEMVLLTLLVGLLNLYDIVKNIQISIFDVININEKNIIYLLLITLFFFFIFFHSNLLSSSPSSLSNSMEFELILGIGLIGLFFLIISNDLILFFLALELYSLSVYLLVFKNELTPTAGRGISILYFLLGSISSSLILLGFAIIYSQTGSLDLNYIIENLPTILNYHNFSMFSPISIGFALFIIGLLFKIGAAPFQFWVIRVYTQMDLNILLYQSIVPKIAYIYIISTIINKFKNNPIGDSFISFLLFLLLSSALLSLFIGPIGGITHGINKFKTIIAYSSVLHVGYLLLGIVSNYYSEAINIFQYLLIYGLNTFQFILAFNLLQSNYKNVNKINMKILFFFFLISIFSFIGLPPFAGFYAKINIILNCFYTNNLLFQFFSIFFIIISTLIALFLYLKFINFFFFTPYLKMDVFQHQPKVEEKRAYIFAYILSFLTIFLFFYPIFLPYISPIFEILSI